jgi:two-component sensor histidine kinase
LSLASTVTTPPDKQGYGTRLVNFTTRQLGGKIDYDWLPEGPVVRMQPPISSLNG